MTSVSLVILAIAIILTAIPYIVIFYLHGRGKDRSQDATEVAPGAAGAVSRPGMPTSDRIRGISPK